MYRFMFTQIEGPIYFIVLEKSQNKHNWLLRSNSIFIFMKTAVSRTQMFHSYETFVQKINLTAVPIPKLLQKSNLKEVQY